MALKGHKIPHVHIFKFIIFIMKLWAVNYGQNKLIKSTPGLDFMNCHFYRKILG
jgi:hypothetical protein